MAKRARFDYRDLTLAELLAFRANPFAKEKTKCTEEWREDFNNSVENLIKSSATSLSFYGGREYSREVVESVMNGFIAEMKGDVRPFFGFSASYTDDCRDGGWMVTLTCTLDQKQAAKE